MRRAIAIIPARYGSKRLPGKPLADIGGKPMIQHVYERTARAARIEGVIVATDDERIASAVESFGGRVTMTPSAIANGTDRIACAAQEVPEAEIIVNVQGDEPLIAPEMIDAAVAVVAERDGIAGTLVRRIERLDDILNPNVVKVALADDGRCLFFSRSPIPFGRDVPQGEWLNKFTFYKHIGLYVFRRDFLFRYTSLKQTPLERAEKLEQLRILEHGFAIHAAVTEFDSFPVDTQEDLQRVQALYQKQYG